MTMVDERLVFADVETGSLDIRRPVIIQIAAIAVDAQYRELEDFEIKIRFNETQASPAALNNNHYDPALWARSAANPRDAAFQFRRFLKRHATIDTVYGGHVFRLAKLVAHNGAEFDKPVLFNWYRNLGISLPASYRVLCTLQRLDWFFSENKHLSPPENYKLATLCQYFGIRLRPEDAHDAFQDDRATVELYRAMARLAQSNLRSVA